MYICFADNIDLCDRRDVAQLVTSDRASDLVTCKAVSRCRAHDSERKEFLVIIKTTRVKSPAHYIHNPNNLPLIPFS